MDGSRDEILTYSAFTANQDRGVGIRDIGEEGANGVHLGAALEQRRVVEHTAARSQPFAGRITFGSAHSCPPGSPARASRRFMSTTCRGRYDFQPDTERKSDTESRDAQYQELVG